MVDGNGYYTDDGIWIYGEADIATPNGRFSDLLNKAQLNLADAIRRLVEAGVSETPVLEAAARAAVAVVLAEEGLFRGVDQTRPVPGVSLFATDASRRQSAFGLDTEGYPTDVALDMWGTKQGMKVHRNEPIDNWELIGVDSSRRIGWGIRSDGTFWAPGVPYVGTQQPPQTPAGLTGLWFYPNPDGSITVRREQGTAA